MLIRGAALLDRRRVYPRMVLSLLFCDIRWLLNQSAGYPLLPKLVGDLILLLNKVSCMLKFNIKPQRHSFHHSLLWGRGKVEFWKITYSTLKERTRIKIKKWRTNGQVNSVDRK